MELFWSIFSLIRTWFGRYSVSPRIQSECRKIQTRLTSNTDTFYAVFILNALDFPSKKFCNFLHFLQKLNTREIVKAYLVCFPCFYYYGNSLNVMFPRFPNHFLSFSMVFPNVFLVFLQLFQVFPLYFLSFLSVFYFRFCESLRHN